MMQQFYPQVMHPYQYELNKDFHFSAAHRIQHTDAGVCQRLHGHTYFVNLTIVGDELDSLGFLVNFKELKDLVHKRWDHAFLNEDAEYFANGSDGIYPTTETVARTICRMVQDHLDSKQNHPTCAQVIVRETPTSYVVFRPKGKSKDE